MASNPWEKYKSQSSRNIFDKNFHNRPLPGSPAFPNQYPKRKYPPKKVPPRPQTPKHDPISMFKSASLPRNASLIGPPSKPLPARPSSPKVAPFNKSQSFHKYPLSDDDTNIENLSDIDSNNNNNNNASEMDENGTKIRKSSHNNLHKNKTKTFHIRKVQTKSMRSIHKMKKKREKQRRSDHHLQYKNKHKKSKNGHTHHSSNGHSKNSLKYDSTHFIEYSSDDNAYAIDDDDDDDDGDDDCKNENQMKKEVKEIRWIRTELIGTGAFGKVYRGYDKNNGKIMAIKQIPFDPLYLSDSSNRELVDREAHVMSNLSHENIVSFYGYQRSIKYKTLVILMEFIDGHSLDVIYHKKGAFCEDLIAKYTLQIMNALQYAHSKNVIHRDIKGKNILISSDGECVKLADFGSAKLTSTTLGNNKFQPSMNYNYTPLWTAPELLIGDYNSKIDIWSVGCVIIEMASANNPWHECQFENAFAALYYIGQNDHFPKYPDHLSKNCKEFITNCLKRDPECRWSAKQAMTHPFISN